jgi:esterase/lipase
LGHHDTSYPWAPMGALLSLLAFVSATSQRLHQVSIPALILHFHGDPTVLDASALTLLSGLGTPASDKRIFWLQRSVHELWQDVDRVAVIEAVVGFVGGGGCSSSGPRTPLDGITICFTTFQLA